MSDEFPPSPEITTGSPTEGEPRVRRISNPRPKKKAKSVAESAGQATADSDPVDPVPRETSARRALPQFPSDSPAVSSGDEELPGASDWPEPEPASPGASGTQEGSSKRKRRRKKGKGGAVQAQAAPAGQESEESSETAAAPRHSAPPAQSHAPRAKVDSELLAKFAWKIYLAEVSEEGVALIGDGDARELSRRCFRLAEIFLEEQGRRR
jgi:hypothetical protein